MNDFASGMDASTLSDLDEFLGRFDYCFSRGDTRTHITTYLAGQHSDVERKNIEAIEFPHTAAKPPTVF